MKHNNKNASKSLVNKQGKNPQVTNLFNDMLDEANCHLIWTITRNTGTSYQICALSIYACRHGEMR